ncbi:unnamed protein product [Rotaria sp. Silwood2]|nr:unnamed protein product [Rotaria sp. Silwood2]CAF4128965.1 unnamed protein product [Rotaria sp. Silwood2]
MLSSRINSNNGHDEDEPAMPSGYESRSRLASRTVPSTNFSLPRPIIPLMIRPTRQPPIIPSMMASQPQLSFRPTISPVRRRKRRQRSITPEIVIERRHRHHQSSGRHRIITIPLDYQPTLGLRGPQQRVLEIERVRCRRHRKRHSSCYEIEYDDSPPSLSQPQPNIIIANPIPNPCSPPAQSSFITYANNTVDPLALFSNLTADIIENLPKQVVYLPTMNFLGSQVNASTEFDTVVFPTEIINPIDGTLSIIQSNSTINASEITNIQPTIPAPAEPQLNNIPTNIRPPMAPLTMTSGPFMQQVQDFLQRLTLSQPQPTSLPSNNTIIEPSLPLTSQYNTATNEYYNLQTIPQINTRNTEPYPSANIRPTNTPNSGSYNSTTFRPSNIMTHRSASNGPSSPANITSYPPANITSYRPLNITPSSRANRTPYHPVTITSSSLANIAPYPSANITPYHPAKITPSSETNITPYHPVTTTSSSPVNITPYRPANITPYHSVNSTSSNLKYPQPYDPASILPSTTSNTGPYRRANITPYHPITTTPSSPVNIAPYYSVNSTFSNPKNEQPYDPASIPPSMTSNTSPYRQANRTPYNTMHSRSGGSSILPLSIPSGSTPYISHSSLISSNFFTTDPLGINNTPMNKPYSSRSSSQTPHRSTNIMPRSILRNTTSNTLSNTTSTHLTLPSVLSPNDIVRKTTTFA